MNKVTINTLISELDRALTFANDCQKPSAMITATMAKAKLLGLDRTDNDHDNEPIPVQVIVNVKDARKR